MLDTLRNSARGTTGKVIVGLIVITFTLFGAESIISIAGNTAPATVNGEDVSELDYQRLLNNRQQELTSQFGAEAAAQLINSPFIQDEILESLISQTLQSQMATQLEFDASEEQVLKTLADIPAFQIDGQFDQNRYQNVLSANGFNHQSFVLAQRQQTALTQFQAGIANTAFVIDKSVERIAALEAQTREIEYKSFNASDFTSRVELTEEDINDYYVENESNYLTEEQVKLDYILITLDSIADQQSINESELQAAYDSYVASLGGQESREISHILFADGDTQAEANAALARLAAGESFADLAVELSDDPGSAEFGGSLGELIPDVYVQEFYDAAVLLQNEGDVTDLVETQYGIHLIRLDSVSRVVADSLESKREELTAEVADRKARDELVVIESELADLSFASDTIKEVAEAFQADVAQSDWVTRSTTEGLFANPQAQQEAFSAPVVDDNLLSAVVRLASGDLLVMQKSEYEPESVQPLEDVRDQAVASLTDIRAIELMNAEIDTIVETQTVSGEGWESVSTLTRRDSSVPAQVVAKSFEMAVGASGVQLAKVESGDTSYLVALKGVTNTERTAEQLEDATSFATSSIGGTDYQVVYNVSRDAADIKTRR